MVVKESPEQTAWVGIPAPTLTSYITVGQLDTKWREEEHLPPRADVRRKSANTCQMLRTVPGTEPTLTKCLLSLIIVIATHYYDPMTCWGSNSGEKTVLVTKGEGTAQVLASCSGH